MNIAAGLIRLHPNSTAHIERWKTTIESRRTEAIKTLVDEGVIFESWFEIEINGEHHLLWYMRKNPEAKFHEVYEKSTKEIDKFHAEIMALISAEHYPATPILDLEQGGATPNKC